MTETREIIPLEDVELDIKRVADQLFLGPQAELLEKIQNFNSRYRNYYPNGNIIQINKNYGFKPGTYDRVKEAFGNNCLGYNSKANNMWSLQYRIDKNSWKQRDFWRSAIAIQNSMISLKNSNAGWQDNVEIVEQFWSDLKERIANDIENALSVFTGDNITVGIKSSAVNNPEYWGQMQLEIELFTSNINMQVFHQDEEIANYEWGNVATKWIMPLWKYVNNWCEGGSQSFSNGISNPSAKIYPKHIGLLHPYIGSVRRYSYQNNLDGWVTYTCTGDMQHDLRQSIWTLDINAICSLSRSWLSRYHIPRTNPLNRIQNCFYAWEAGMDAKIWSHNESDPQRVMSNCKWPRMFQGLIDYEGDNPCDICQFKDGYAYLVGNPSIPDDAEYPGQDVREVSPCTRAITEYEIPETEDDIIREACIMHIMCCSVLRNIEGVNEHIPAIDYMLSEQNRFPADANLETIYELHPNFNIDSAFRSESANWRNQHAEDVLDVVFDSRVWFDVVEEYIELHGLSDEEAGDVEYDFRSESIAEIRRMINTERQRRSDQLENPTDRITLEMEREGTPFDPLTPEELTIRWATQNGRTLNI